VSSSIVAAITEAARLRTIAECPTAANLLEPPLGTQIEISGESLALAEEIGKRIHTQGGAALVIDYGDDFVHAGSLQGIRDHMQMPVLSQSGTVDLSSHVDFCAIKNIATQHYGS
jgi:NADH dehydrogenase [ubiquinone] 1 alpha subcomplex assembly factor 7